jgi:hypothetical protein
MANLKRLPKPPMFQLAAPQRPHRSVAPKGTRRRLAAQELCGSTSEAL